MVLLGLWCRTENAADYYLPPTLWLGLKLRRHHQSVSLSCLGLRGRDRSNLLQSEAFRDLGFNFEGCVSMSRDNYYTPQKHRTCDYCVPALWREDGKCSSAYAVRVH